MWKILTRNFLRADFMERASVKGCDRFRAGLLTDSFKDPKPGVAVKVPVPVYGSVPPAALTVTLDEAPKQ